MRSTAAVIMFALAMAVSAMDNLVVEYTTEIHTAYTTICPNATQFIFDHVTYTATESTTLTITNCPCTVVKPIYTTSSVYCDTCSTPTPPAYSNTTGAHSQPTKNVETTSTVIPAPAIPSQTKIASSSAAKVLVSATASRAILLGFLVHVMSSVYTS